LANGANSFMHNTLSIRNWNAFDAAKKVNDFPLIKGENPTDKAFESSISKGSGPQKSAPKKKVVRRKKKEVEGGCG